MINKKALNLIYKKSKTYLLAEKVSSYINRIVFSSSTYKLIFGKTQEEDYFNKSVIARILNFFIKILLWPRCFLAKHNIYQTSALKSFLDLIFDINIPDFIFGSKIITGLVNFLGLDAQSLIITNKSKRGKRKYNKKPDLVKTIFWSATLILFFAAANFIGLKKALIIIPGGIFSLLVLYNTKFGVFALSLFFALLPTKFTLAIILLTLFSFWFNLFFNNRFSSSINLIDVFIIFFSGLIFYSTLVSVMPLKSIKMSLVYILFIAFYFVLKSTINNKQDLFIIISLMILSVGLVSLIGIAQKFLGLSILANNNNNWIDQEMFSGNTIRVFSTLDNPNVLGEYLLIMIPICFGGIYYLKNKFCKLFAFLIFGLSCVCMLLTLSRGAWLGLIFAMTIFIILRDKRLLWLLILFILAAPIFIPKSFIQRFMSIGNMADSSTSYRVNIWIGSLKIIKDFWPIGIGLGTKNFVYIYQKYALSASYALHSHNFYLQILIDLGITGLILLFAIITLFYKSLLANNKFLSDDFIKTLKISLCAGFTGYLIQGLADNIWYNYRVAFLFWFIISTAGICSKLSSLNIWAKFKFLQHESKFN